MTQPILDIQRIVPQRRALRFEEMMIQYFIPILAMITLATQVWADEFAYDSRPVYDLCTPDQIEHSNGVHFDWGHYQQWTTHPGTASGQAALWRHPGIRVARRPCLANCDLKDRAIWPSLFARRTMVRRSVAMLPVHGLRGKNLTLKGSPQESRQTIKIGSGYKFAAKCPTARS